MREQPGLAQPDFIGKTYSREMERSMRAVLHTAQEHLFPAMLAALLGLAACSGPRRETIQGQGGVGTPDVSAYMPAGQATSLHALLNQCRQISGQSSPGSEDRGAAASCAQLRRSLHNQPGNALPTDAE